MRVYEFSKLSGMSNKEIIKTLSEAGFNVQSHMSALSEESIAFLQDKQKKTEKPKKVEPSDAMKKKTKDLPLTKKVDVEASKSESIVSKKKNEPTETPKDEAFVTSETTQEKNIIKIKAMPLSELAKAFNISLSELILTLMKRGLNYNKNQVIPEELVEQLATDFGFNAIKEEKKIEQQNAIKVGKFLKRRAPVVVVIGHVDHGKTTLLDFIRKSRVALKEKGGITQHLGAYQVNTAHGDIVFLDTPGHEAFSMMRGRGVRVADIAVLIVAADDGVMPQTIEAIKLAESKNIPVMVAINKIDKVENARIDQVKSQLSKFGLMPEDWGGQTIFIPISAKLGLGIEQLLEMIVLQSEVMDLSADESVNACGFVLESKLQKGLGAVGTFIAQHGIIKIGDFFVCGKTYGKVNVLLNSDGVRINSASPSMPVQISGFDELPQAGDYLQVISEPEYRNVKADKSEAKNLTAFKVIPKESINIILKTDNDSSKEALLDSISKLAKKNERQLYVAYSGVGNVTENDVILASNIDAVIYSFGVKTETNVNSLASKNSVVIKQFDIIYKLLDDLKDLIKRSQEVKVKYVKIGDAIVRKVFDIKGIGIIAGFYVKDGKISKNCRVSIWRGSKNIGEGEIKTLQRDKKAMKEIAVGFEGALLIENFKDWAVDDRIECFVSVPIE